MFFFYKHISSNSSAKILEKYTNDFRIIEEEIEIKSQMKSIDQNEKISRIEIILNELRKHEDQDELLRILSSQGFFIDELEKKVIQYFLTKFSGKATLD